MIVSNALIDVQNYLVEGLPSKVEIDVQKSVIMAYKIDISKLLGISIDKFELSNWQDDCAAI